MKKWFSQLDIKQLDREYEKIEHEYSPLMKFYISQKLISDKAKEYLNHGFARRINILYRCIHNVYKIWPPDKSRPLYHDERTDVIIFVNAFLTNLYGSLDNLGHIWANEKINDNLTKHEIGIMKKHPKIRSTFSDKFQERLKKYDKWMDFLEERRHALAHRIPPYIPPFTVARENTERYNSLEKLLYSLFEKANGFDEKTLEIYKETEDEMRSLERPEPLMAHSFSEKSKPFFFHAQIIIDWKNVVEISKYFFEEFE